MLNGDTSMGYFPFIRGLSYVELSQPMAAVIEILMLECENLKVEDVTDIYACLRSITGTPTTTRRGLRSTTSFLAWCKCTFEKGDTPTTTATATVTTLD